jgi:hypothetical protein
MTRRRIISAVFAALVLACVPAIATSASTHAEHQVYVPLVARAAPQPEGDWFGCLIEWWLCGPAE